MGWIKNFITDSEIKKIEAAIDRAEELTSGEIVPVIVTRSASVGHVPLTLTLLLTLVVVVAELPFSEWLWVTPWAWLWPVVLVVIYGVAHFLAKLMWVQKIFVPERDEVEEVHQRAHLEFYANRVNRTQGGTGVLIFVSVMEKKAVVLADEALAQKVPKETWDQVVSDLGKKLHKGEWGEGFVDAIHTCGRHLQTHFPIQGARVNELKNHLVIK